MNLDSEIKRHYQRKRLEPADVNRLVRIANTPNPVWWRSAPRMAAVALILLAGVVLMNRVLNQPVAAPPDLAASIAKHVVFYHEEPMPLAVRTDDLRELTMEMPRLDFTPSASHLVTADRYRLYGARYCHIEGKIAVQMRLTREDGQSVTLYQVADQPEFDAVDGAEFEWNGYVIRMWRENGVLMCLAEKKAVSV